MNKLMRILDRLWTKGCSSGAYYGSTGVFEKGLAREKIEKLFLDNHSRLVCEGVELDKDGHLTKSK